MLAAFGTEVDHAVRGRDDVQVVLDDDDGIAPVHEPLQRGDELCDVRHVQPRRGLVEHEDGPPEGGRGELGGQLDPLRFATGKRRARLPELEIPEPDLREEVERPPHRREWREELAAFVDRHGENVGDGFSLQRDGERIRVVAAARADLATDVDLRQERHRHAEPPLALALLAAAAGNVE